MKKLAIATVFATAFTAPAFAGSMTIEFAPSDGDTVTIILDTENNTAQIGDETTPYTWDEATLTLCGGEVCATFDEMVDTVGGSTGYTRQDGVKGTATLKAKSE